MLNFEKLDVYQEAVKFARDIYKLTRNFPKTEIFGLTGQLRRASVSISLNIAEGTSRSKKEFSHFLDMARGSCYECIPLLEIAFQLAYITQSDHDNFYTRVDNLARRLNALKKSLTVNREL